MVSLDDGAYLIVATELVDSGLQDAVVALGHTEFLHAPGLATAGIVHGGVVGGDGPVGAYHTFEMGLIAQLLLDEPAAVAAAHVLAGGILLPENTVDGHDSGSHRRTTGQFESSFGEGTFMHGKVAAGVYGELAVGEVGVAP